MIFFDFSLKTVLWKIAGETKVSETARERKVRIIQNKIHDCEQERSYYKCHFTIYIYTHTHTDLLLSERQVCRMSLQLAPAACFISEWPDLTLLFDTPQILKDF